MESSSHLTNKITTGPKTTQNKDVPRSSHHKRLQQLRKTTTMANVLLLAYAFLQMLITLPSGLSSTVARRSTSSTQRIFPKVTMQPPPKGNKGFTVANGNTIPHQGFVHTAIQTVEGDKYTVQWKNADFAMPILSTHELAKNNKKTRI